ncbi:MAG: hypothetical protein JNL70_08705 [Saprospiraceae bacterium]|nr:hypothetical protein [Saprospiraceae bacterium]
MKKLSILLLSLCFIMSKCPDDTPKLEELPPISQTGANSVGCLINGEVWIPSKWRITGSPRYISIDTSLEKTMTINFQKNAPFINLLIVAKYKHFQLGGLQLIPSLTQFSNVEICNNESFFLDTINYLNYLKINFIDTSRQKRIIAGEFQLRYVSKDCKDTINITKGRFDMPFSIE